MKPQIEAFFKIKRHRGPHKWTAWQWYGAKGQVRRKVCTVSNCGALVQQVAGEKVRSIQPERWNSGKWKRRSRKSKEGRKA